MQFEVIIGQEEQHRINFRFNKFWGFLSIKVDDKKVVGDFRSYSRELVAAYQFMVGTKEIHTVKILKIRPQLMAGFRSNRYEVHVDGALYKVFTD